MSIISPGKHLVPQVRQPWGRGHSMDMDNQSRSFSLPLHQAGNPQPLGQLLCLLALGRAPVTHGNTL